MVSSSLKTFVATLVVVIGVAVCMAALLTPTTVCTSTQVDGGTVEQECKTDESLERWVEIGLVTGTVSWAGGLLGVYRYGAGAGRVVSVAVGGFLTLLGGAWAYVFIQWYLNLSSDPGVMQQMGDTDLMVLLALAAVGGSITLVGLLQVWRALSSRRVSGG